MGLYVGSKEIKDLYVGGKKVAGAYLGKQLVRPSGRKPGVNTIAYYTFDNLQDKINNSHPLTLSGTAKYGTVGRKKYFEFNGSTFLSASPMIPPAGPFTVSFWGYAENTPFFFQQFNSNTNNTSISIYVENDRIFIWSKGPNDWDTGYPLEHNKRVLYQYVYTSGSIKIYVNGTLIGTKSRTINTTTPNYFWLGKGGEAYSPSISASGTRISEFIVENKARTDSEIQDYYNLTKSNYGY